MKARGLPDSVYMPPVNNWAPADRYELLTALAMLQRGVCTVCNERLTGIIDVHECIVTKGDVQSWPNGWKFLINNLYNCVVVHRACHHHGDRQRWWNYKCKQFGKEEMERWYYNLPFKGKQRRFE